MSLPNFIPFIQEILDKNSGELYVEKRNPDKTISKVKLNSIDQIERNREVNLNFFIVSPELRNENESFYDDKICQYVIEGTGGRD